MDKRNEERDESRNEQPASDRRAKNPFRYDTGKSEEDLGADEQAENEQERKEALTERD